MKIIYIPTRPNRFLQSLLVKRVMDFTNLNSADLGRGRQYLGITRYFRQKGRRNEEPYMINPLTSLALIKHIPHYKK